MSLGAARDELDLELSQRDEDPALMALMAEAYHGDGEHMDSVRWLKKAFPRARREGVPEEYLSLLYPLRSFPVIESEARLNALDPYFVSAIIYQESRFTANARSTADARGLMQLIPSTGRLMARQVGVRKLDVSQLYEPELNVKLGTRYIAQLLQDFKGERELALAGYNAGPGRVRRWLRKNRGAELDEFVESIPYKETRIYVKNILEAHFQYHRLYGGQNPYAPLAATRAGSDKDSEDPS